jgi:type III pantothenate kinase
VKAALFDNGQLVRLVESGELKVESYDNAIVVSTRGGETETERLVKERAGRFLKLDHSTPVPIKNLYATPETLGYDRLAAAVGAAAMFPGKNVLIVDFGTAITYDIVTAAGEFLGGNISPGAALRFRALHEGTGALPLGSLPKGLTRNAAANKKERSPENTGRCPVLTDDGLSALPEFPARDTKTAIESGVAVGIIAETEYYIETAKAKYGEIEIIFTGGDAEYVMTSLRFRSPCTIFNCASLVLDRLRFGNAQKNLAFRSPCTIFAVSELVFRGLNAILEHNDAK